jgi:hypothetical protein
LDYGLLGLVEFVLKFACLGWSDLNCLCPGSLGLEYLFGGRAVAVWAILEPCLRVGQRALEEAAPQVFLFGLASLDELASRVAQVSGRSACTLGLVFEGWQDCYELRAGCLGKCCGLATFDAVGAI